MSETYEILVLRYARVTDRTRLSSFMCPDDHASPHTIDFFVWVIRNANRTILLDTGFDRVEAKLRGRSVEFEPVEALQQIGISAESITP